MYEHIRKFKTSRVHLGKSQGNRFWKGLANAISRKKEAERRITAGPVQYRAVILVYQQLNQNEVRCT